MDQRWSYIEWLKILIPFLHFPTNYLFSQLTNAKSFNLKYNFVIPDGKPYSVISPTRNEYSVLLMRWCLTVHRVCRWNTQRATRYPYSSTISWRCDQSTGRDTNQPYKWGFNWKRDTAGLTSRWHHVNVIESQIPFNSIVYSISYSGKQNTCIKETLCESNPTTTAKD